MCCQKYLRIGLKGRLLVAFDALHAGCARLAMSMFHRVLMLWLGKMQSVHCAIQNNFFEAEAMIWRVIYPKLLHLSDAHQAMMHQAPKVLQMHYYKSATAFARHKPQPHH